MTETKASIFITFVLIFLTFAQRTTILWHSKIVWYNFDKKENCTYYATNFLGQSFNIAMNWNKMDWWKNTSSRVRCEPASFMHFFWGMVSVNTWFQSGWWFYNSINCNFSLNDERSVFSVGPTADCLKLLLGVRNPEGWEEYYHMEPVRLRAFQNRGRIWTHPCVFPSRVLQIQIACLCTFAKLDIQAYSKMACQDYFE